MNPRLRWLFLMVQSMPLVTLCFWRSLRASRVCSGPVEFAVSGLLWSSLTAQTCFCKCPWSGSAPAEVPGLGLVLQRSLALIYFLGVPRLRFTWTCRGPCSELFPQRSQTTPGPQRSWLPPRSQTHAQTHSGLWLWPSSSAVAPRTCSYERFIVSVLLRPRSLTQSCLCKCP